MAIKSENKREGGNTQNLAHFLSSALFLEEQLSNSVYRDYLDREDWPVNLRHDVIEDSSKH
jgi:hypothetical protein